MKEREKIIWIKDTLNPDAYGVCGVTGRIARITHLYDAKPHLVLPVDHTPMQINNGECSCANTCLDIDCDLNCYDREAFFKQHGIVQDEYGIDPNFGCRTLYFNVRKVELIDLMDFVMFPEILHVFQDMVFEIIEE